MLRTDLDGLINNIKESPVSKLAALIIGLIILYCLVSGYLSSKKIWMVSKNKFKTKENSI